MMDGLKIFVINLISSVSRHCYRVAEEIFVLPVSPDLQPGEAFRSRFVM
jgi:hypothetical protein